MTLEEMKRLAEIVTGHTAKIYGVHDQVIRVLPPGGITSSYWFMPSLTGSNWQVVQAVGVLRKLAETEIKDDEPQEYAYHSNIIRAALITGNIDTASRALLAGGGV